jgi:hypothetical protein
VKKILWFLSVTIVLASTFSVPIRLHADGNPVPVCPSKQTCQP